MRRHALLTNLVTPSVEIEMPTGDSSNRVRKCSSLSRSVSSAMASLLPSFECTSFMTFQPCLYFRLLEAESSYKARNIKSVVEISKTSAIDNRYPFHRFHPGSIPAPQICRVKNRYRVKNSRRKIFLVMAIIVATHLTSSTVLISLGGTSARATWG